MYNLVTLVIFSKTHGHMKLDGLEHYSYCLNLSILTQHWHQDVMYKSVAAAPFLKWPNQCQGKMSCEIHET